MNSISRVRVCVWRAAWVLGASLILLLSCLPAFAQGGLGAIQGAITNATGGPVSGAMVSVIDLARGETRPLTTDQSGLYSASGLTPGAYTVRVQAMGFKTMEHTGITVPVGATLIVDFALQPGAQSEVVTITAEVLPANSASVVENKAISETPVNGRNFVNLVEARNTGQTTQPGQAGNYRTTNGMRTDQNNPLIDGVYDGDIDTGWQIMNGFGFQGSIDPDVIMPLDSIGEINNNGYPRAEYGGHPGNTSNLGIKSGTNTIHGSLYGYGRDADMNARNPFRAPLTGTCNLGGSNVPCDTIPGAGKTGYAMTQWGASIGGKIKKDKVFYFLNFERQRYNVGATTLNKDPTTASIGNAQISIPDAIAAIVSGAGASKLNQLALNLAGCGDTAASGGVPAHTGLTVAQAQAMAGSPGSAFAPFCNSSVGIFGNGSGSSTIPFGNNSIGGPDAGVAKMDYRINDKNSVSGELFVGNAGPEVAGTKFSSQPWWVIEPTIRMYIVRGVWVYSPNSNMVNEARFGLDKLNQAVTPSDCAGTNGAPNFIDAYGMNSGTFLTCQMPYQTFVGATGGFTPIGVTPGSGPFTTNEADYVGIDSFSWTRGKHIIKFGVEIHRGSVTSTGGGAQGIQLRGTLSYGTTAGFAGANALEDFLTGTPTLGTAFTGSATGVVPDVRVNYYAGFIQDTYRLNRRLTIDLGLRYEFMPAFSQPGNLLGFYNPGTCAAGPNCSSLGYTSGLGQESSGTPLYHQDTWQHNFAPRGGIAWDVFGTGKTVVRVVGNIMYAQPGYAGESGAQNVPTGADFYNPNGTFFTNPAGQNLSSIGTVQVTSGIPFNVCNPALPGGMSCTAAQTFFGSQVLSGTPACGDGRAVGAFTNPKPCNLQINDPNLYTPYFGMWMLNLQQALGKNMSLTLAYIGNHGSGIRQIVDINQPAPGASGAVAEQTRRPLTTNCPNGSIPGLTTGTTSGPCLPWIGQLLDVANSDISNTDALQATLSLRGYRGMTMNLNYTLQHCLDEYSNNEQLWRTLADSTNPQRDYGTCPTATPQRVTFNFNWAIPGRRSPGQLLQGWAVNATAVYLPLRYPSATGLVDNSLDTSGTGNLNDLWNIFGSPHNFGPSLWGLGSNLTTWPCFGAAGGTFAAAGCPQAGTATVNVPLGPGGPITAEPAIGPGGICTINAAKEPNGPGGTTGIAQLLANGCYASGGSVLLPPAQGTFGDMSRNAFLIPGYFNMDFSITKTWGFLKEQRLKAQVRAEFFNVLNVVNYGGGGVDLGSVKTLGAYLSTPNAGAQIVSGVGGEREMQLGLKFLW